MKAVLTLTIISGFLFSSVSFASCPLKYSQKMNRMSASAQKTNFYNIAAKGKTTNETTGVDQSAAARK